MFRRVYPILLLVAFLYYFCAPMLFGRVYFRHPDIFGYYFPFREWFRSHLLSGRFPLWNDAWGFGRYAIHWHTVPIDLLTIPEILFGSQAHHLLVMQWVMVLIISCFAVFLLSRRTDVALWTGVLFFLLPWTNYFLYYYVHAFWFAFHALGLALLVLYLRKYESRYLAYFTGAFALGMLGMKLELSLLEGFFFPLFALMFELATKPKPAGPRILLALRGFALVSLCVIAAFLINSFQVHPLLKASFDSARSSDAMGQALAMRDFYDSLGHSLRHPSVLLIIHFFLLAVRWPAGRGWQWARIAVYGLLGLQYIRTFHQEPELALTLDTSNVMLRAMAISGALLALARGRIGDWPYYILGLLVVHFIFGRPHEGALGEMANYRSMSPYFQTGLLAFFLFGMSTGRRSRIVLAALIGILIVLIMRSVGNVFLSRAFGFIWLPTRDSYILEFSLALITAQGLRASLVLLAIHVRRFSFTVRRPMITAAGILVSLGVVGFYPLLYPHNPYSVHRAMNIEHQAPEGRGYQTFKQTVLGSLQSLRERSGERPRLLNFDDIAKAYGFFGLGLLADVAHIREYSSTNMGDYARFAVRESLPGEFRTLRGLTGAIAPLRHFLPRSEKNNVFYYRYILNSTPPLNCNFLRFAGVDFISVSSDTSLDIYFSRGETIQTAKDCLGPEESLAQAFPGVPPARIFAVQKSLPDAFVIENVRAELLGSINPATVTMGESRLSFAPGGNFTWRPARVSRSLHETKLELTPGPAGTLVLTDFIHSGWERQSDGERPHKVFELFRGLNVPEATATSEILLRYHDRDHDAALLLSFLALLGLAFSLWRTRR